jgi:hypothetical protein
LPAAAAKVYPQRVSLWRTARVMWNRSQKFFDTARHRVCGNGNTLAAALSWLQGGLQ